jgi:hypothetical protein
MIRFGRAKRSLVIVRSKPPGPVRSSQGEPSAPPECAPSEPPVSIERPVMHDADTLPLESEEEERFFSAAIDGDDSETTDPSPVGPLPTGESLAPSVSAKEAEKTALGADGGPTLLALDPALLARRAHLRRVVVGVLGASLGVLFAGALVRRHSESIRTEPRPNLSAVSSPMTRVAPAARALSSDVSHVIDVPAPALPPTASNDAPANSAESDDPAREDPNTLIHTARALLESGHVREGVAIARDAVQANPAEAEPYILLAAGLQDLGDWNEARTVFAECQQKARRGPNDSCRYFARR